MEVVVSFTVDGDGLLGWPTEYNPRLVVHTTDPTQRMSVTHGKAFNEVPLIESPSQKGSFFSRYPVTFSPPLESDSSSEDESSDEDAIFNTSDSEASKKTPRQPPPEFPINDPMADLCIALYVDSRSFSSNLPVPASEEEAKKQKGIDPLPYTVAMGQIYIPWHVLLRFAVSDGHAEAARKDYDLMSTPLDPFIAFPSTTMKQEFSSLVTRDGIAYRIAVLESDTETRSLAVELRAMDKAQLAHKATLRVHMAFISTRGAPRTTWGRRLEKIEAFMINNRPHPDEPRKKGLDRFVDACRRYDQETYERDQEYNEAMKRYMTVYDQLWNIDETTKVLRLSLPNENTSLSKGALGGGGGGVTHFTPDVPSMKRFHLPTWVLGEERIPFVKLWTGTLPGMARHLPEATKHTEHWVKHLLDIGIKRANITSEEFVATIRTFTSDAAKQSLETLRKGAEIGTVEHNSLIRCIEALSYTVLLISHVCRYNNDVRHANKKISKGDLRKMAEDATYNTLFIYDVESPQIDVQAGIASDADCEDDELAAAFLASLIEFGRLNGDAKTGGRGWTVDIAAAAFDALKLIVHFNHFGAVKGAQLSDAKDNENDEGFVRSREDLEGAIGGHTYQFGSTIPFLEERYRKNSVLVMQVTGRDLAAILRRYVDGVLGAWIPVEDATRLELLRIVWASLPAFVNEGTGRQEPLLLPLEMYFGKTEELLKRTASHASEIEVLRIWPRKKLPSASTQTGAATKEQQPSVHSLGEALPYSFQRRILSESRYTIDPQSGARVERQLSPFYTRLGVSVSSKLELIDSKAFNHMIWVSPSRMTYGPLLREYLEPDGDAIPMPLPSHLRETYEGTQHSSDIMGQRMRRMIPVDVTFAHRSTSAALSSYDSKIAKMSAMNATGSLFVHSSAPGSPSSERGENTPDALHTLSSDFFASTLVRSNATDDTNNRLLSKGSTAGVDISNVKSVHKVYVSSESAVARVMRSAGKSDTNRWETLAPGRLNVRYESTEQAHQLHDLIASSKGVSEVEIVHERMRESLPEMLSAYFKRRVAFIIDDDKASPLGPVKQSSALLKLSRVPFPSMSNIYGCTQDDFLAQ